MSPLAPSSEPEPPFRPREKIMEKQRFFQSVHKPTYLKGRYDAITSVAIPLALAVFSMYLVVSGHGQRPSQTPNLASRLYQKLCGIGRGIYNMSHGIGKKD